MGTSETGTRPVVVGVIVSPGEGLPPGLAGLDDAVEPRLVRDTDELARECGDAEVLFVWDFNRRLIEDAWPQLGALRWIHAASAGVDAIVFPGLAEREVVVTNTQGVLDDAIAEWVLGVLMVFAKDLHTTLALQRERRWQHRESERLAGRRVLVVGAGRIGGAVARLCQAAGMDVDGIASHPREPGGGFDRVGGPESLVSWCPEADFVVVCAPLTAATAGLVGREALAALKPTARLVNVGRGPVVDEEALIEALAEGRVAGAALDVFASEPLPEDHPLWEMDNVIVSPHMAGDFIGWREAFSGVFLDNLARWRRGEPLVGTVPVASMVVSGDR